jgi:hypothetical protein
MSVIELAHVARRHDDFSRCAINELEFRQQVVANDARLSACGAQAGELLAALTALCLEGLESRKAVSS